MNDAKFRLVGKLRGDNVLLTARRTARRAPRPHSAEWTP
jgi:hypothetical protein